MAASPGRERGKTRRVMGGSSINEVTMRLNMSFVKMPDSIFDEDKVVCRLFGGWRGRGPPCRCLSFFFSHLTVDTLFCLSAPPPQAPGAHPSPL